MNLADGFAGLGVGGSGDGAGVDDDEGGLTGGTGGGAATLKKLALDGGGVGLRGTAAELFDVESRHFAKETEPIEFSTR